jgi:membrane-associated phospholipid phosphatase
MNQLRPVWRAALVTTLLTAAFVAVYLVAFASDVGHRADAAVFHRVSQTDLEEVRRVGRHFGRHALDTIAITAVVLVGTALSLTAFIRRRRDLGWLIPLLIGGSFTTTELVKPPLSRLGRELARDRSAAGSFPSGHATIAMAVLLGTVVAAPPLLRAAVAIGAIVGATIIAILIVAVGLHPPSDILGGYLVSAVWAASLSAFLRNPRGSPSTAEIQTVPAVRRDRLFDAVVVGIVCFTVLTVVATTQLHLLETIRLHRTILVMTTVFAIAAGVIVSAIAALAQEPKTMP